MSPRARSILRYLHRWIGFPAGLFLFVLCFTGALSSFGMEIQGWMQPRTALTSPLPHVTDQALAKAAKQLQAEWQQGKVAFLKLPSERDPVFRLWHYDGHIFRGPALAPDTGQPLKQHDVTGGNFFITLHSTLYLPTPWGHLLIILVGVSLLITLLTGLWLQLRRFLPDLLLFRPKAVRQRRWLDLHLLSGGLAIPFLFIVGLSGVVLQSRKLANFITPPHHAAGHVSRHQTHGFTPPPLSEDMLIKLAHAGTQQWGDKDGGFFMSTGKETALFAPDTLYFCLQRQSITLSHPQLPPRNLCPTTHSFFVGLHNLRWADLTTRWLYCLSGLLGSFIMGAGIILFLYSEQNYLAHNNITSPLHHGLMRLYSATATGTLLGLPLATLALFWSTRLPSPANLSPIAWEEGLFFSLWGLTYVHSFLSPRIYRFYIALLIPLGLGISGLDLLTRPLHTGRPWLFFSIDLLATLSGLSALIYYWYDKPCATASKGSHI